MNLAPFIFFAVTQITAPALHASLYFFYALDQGAKNPAATGLRRQTGAAHAKRYKSSGLRHLQRPIAEIVDKNQLFTATHGPPLRKQTESPMQNQLLRTIRDEHQSLAAMLHALELVIARGPGDVPERYFEIVDGMLVYIKEFSEHVHFPKEVELLFPTVLEVAPDTLRAVARLEKSHRESVAELVELQGLLAAWQRDGRDPLGHRAAFERATARVCQSYLEQIRMEEVSILPAAEQLVKDAQWRKLVVQHHKATTAGQLDALDESAYELMYNRIALWLTRFLTHKALAHE